MKRNLTAAVRFAFIFFLLSAIMLPAFTLGASASSEQMPSTDDAPIVYVYNIENSVPIIEKNSTNIISTGASTKIMTGLVAIDILGNRLDEKITVTERMLSKSSGRARGFKAGEIVTVRQMLYATICGGYNDAACILAYTAADSYDEFVGMMNKKASELGATNTKYLNVTGLNETGMYTTAVDIAVIARAAFENRIFLEICNTDRYTMEPTNLSEARLIPNRNSLVSNYYYTAYYNRYANGLCVGADDDGFGIITVARKNNLTYICVFMQTDNEETAYKLANNIINWVLDSFGYVKLLDGEGEICKIKVSMSDKKSEISVVPANEITIYMSLGIDTDNGISYSYSLDSDTINAPVQKGQKCGFITVTDKENGTILATVDLVTAEDAEQGGMLRVLSAIGAYTSSRAFRATLVFLAVFSIIFFTVRYINKKRNRRRKNYF